MAKSNNCSVFFFPPAMLVLVQETGDDADNVQQDLQNSSLGYNVLGYWH